MRHYWMWEEGEWIKFAASRNSLKVVVVAIATRCCYGCCVCCQVQSKGLDTHKKVLCVEHVDRLNEACIALTSRINQLTKMQEDVKISISELQLSSEHANVNARNPLSHNQDEISLAKPALDKISSLEAVNIVMNGEFKRCLTDKQALSVEITQQKAKTDKLHVIIKEIDRQVTVTDITMAEHTMRIQSLETANYNGVLVWPIDDFARKRQEAIARKTNSVYSHAFYTSRVGKHEP
jgi:hypothetical protein